MNSVLRVFAIVCAFTCSLLIYVQGQLITCRYFAGCSVDRIGNSCKLVLDRVSCTTDNILAFTPQCLPDQCKTDCDCQCSNSSVNIGKHGQITFYDQCVEAFRFQEHECNNCGNPYPTPTPTPTPPPPPCAYLYEGCTYHSDCCEGFCAGDSGCDLPLEYCNPPCTGEYFCFEERCSDNTPILVDLLGDGYRLTNARNGVNFDFNGDGIANKIAWTSGNSDDAWLVLDRNGNGTIDNGIELFGNRTSQSTLPSGEERHGFRALAEYDWVQRGGNGDRKIDQRDAIFRSLRLWQDVNHNGHSELSELHMLSELGLATLELNYKLSRRVDQYGNQFRYRAKIEAITQNQLSRWAWDVILVGN